MANDKGTGINWAKAIQRTGGAADLAATLALCEQEASEFIAANEIPQARIRSAVEQVFTKNPKTSYDMGSLATRVLVEMSSDETGVVPGSEAKLGEMVKSFVRAESAQFVATAGAEGLYYVSRGRSKNGSVRRSSPELVAEYKALQLAKAAKDA